MNLSLNPYFKAFKQAYDGLHSDGAFDNTEELTTAKALFNIQLVVSVTAEQLAEKGDSRSPVLRARMESLIEAAQDCIADLDYRQQCYGSLTINRNFQRFQKVCSSADAQMPVPQLKELVKSVLADCEAQLAKLDAEMRQAGEDATGWVRLDDERSRVFLAQFAAEDFQRELEWRKA